MEQMRPMPGRGNFNQAYMNQMGGLSKEETLKELVEERLFKARSVFSPGGRVLMNVVPVFINLFAPWGVFVFITGLLAFSFPYRHPAFTAVVLVLVGFAWIILVFVAIWQRRQNPDPTWFTYVAAIVMCAILGGACVGVGIHENLSKPYYEIQNLKVINNFDPGTSWGQNVLDAGIFYFNAGSKLDGEKTWHFKHKSIYCVAPVVGNGSSPTTQSYDFWAVGKDCCSISASDFRCGAWGKMASRSAIRVLDDKAIAYYRLAVQQAESLYDITAKNPIFFHWADDPVVEINGWSRQAFKEYLFASGIFFVFALFCLCIALCKFSWIGRTPPRTPQMEIYGSTF